ncbi:predicted protein [Histoplasma mississippiense (nom. inval.)]|uniref:predicted protein n=1 Tax=Ajellomyces capsulatus (strain NAm1 / WU24) TaxID=2059318 RepID=UPI000157D032|nr:predicted protein [Histoplasma mississippiense (nom. inval.)]EDN04239.1 predicted protein [Histoplasma mississippiense (nom. inval.)]
MNTMRKHWQNKHSWSPYPSRGRTAPQKRTAAQDEVDRSCQKVQFQQVFASRKGSHYIQIQTKETTEHTGTPDQNRASHVIDELERFYREQQRQTSNVIQAGEHDEANPWLRRTRWPVYLTNIAPNDLVNCVQRPEDDTTCPDELAARAIGRPWGRLPVPASESSHGWATSSASRPSAQSDTRPGTPRCRHTWTRRGEHRRAQGADQRHSISPDPMDEQMTEEEEEEEEKGQRDTQPEEEDKFKLTKMQMACLDFCIELLNQRVQVEDYECALVDALAVLGRGEYGWCDAESYPPILSRIIKVARLCHTVLNDQVNFRPQMQQLGKLMAAKTQMVLLTATLPPGEEEKLWSRMHCTRADISLFRARTCRPNVAYRVWQPIIEGSEYDGLNRWFQAPSVVRFIQDRMRWTGEGKGVVYCQAVNQVTMMASTLRCGAYHHHQINKAGILECFQQGQHQVIVATSALGMGIDIPNIRSIIHVGRPRSLLDYGQESGRAGRDGQASEAIIIEPEGISAAMIWSRKDAPSLLDQKLVDRYMQAGGEEGDEPMARCRRVVLDRYLDGEVEGYMRRHCGDRHTGESQCDGCDAEWEAREAVFTPSPGGTPTPTPSPGYSSRATAKDDSSEDETSQESEMESQQGETHIRFNGTCSPRMARSVSKSTDDNINESITKNEASTSGGSSPGQWNKQESSEISEDTRGIPSTTRQTFHKQDVRRGRFIITHQQRGQRALMDEEVLVEEAQRWKDQCLICASGKREFDHELYQCPHEESQEAKRWMMTVRSKIKYTRYSGCFRCGMPQSICNSWKTQRQCPVQGIFDPDSGNDDVWVSQQLREFNVNADDQEAVIEFLRQKVEGQGIEHNQLMEMFCWLRGIYQEAERGKIESEGTGVK